MSTQLSGLPFSGPIGGVRVALIDGQWVAFPQLQPSCERAVFDMVVAGRVVGRDDGADVAIMMVEAEATESAWNLIKGETSAPPTEEVVAQGLEAAKPFIAELVPGAAADLAAQAAKADRRSSRSSRTTQDDAYAAVEARRRRRPRATR